MLCYGLLCFGLLCFGFVFIVTLFLFRFDAIVLLLVCQDELFAIYNVADVCLVTSVRDGMNLVSHEYVAAQSEPRQPVVAGAFALCEDR